MYFIDSSVQCLLWYHKALCIGPLVVHIPGITLCTLISTMLKTQQLSWFWWYPNFKCGFPFAQNLIWNRYNKGKTQTCDCTHKTIICCPSRCPVHSGWPGLYIKAGGDILLLSATHACWKPVCNVYRMSCRDIGYKWCLYFVGQNKENRHTPPTPPVLEKTGGMHSISYMS